MTKFTPLHSAAMNDNEMVVRTLIAAGADIAARDRDGNTPLHLTNATGIITALRAAGADANARTDHGLTSLMITAFYGNGAGFSALLAAGADISVPSRDGATPLHSAPPMDIAILPA